MTLGSNRRQAQAVPVVPHGIIPAPGGGETRSAALVDIQLCASLMIVFIVLVVMIVLFPWVWPTVQDNPGLWPLILPGVLSMVGLSRRSYIRIVRLRRS
ncbi:hypothetical protein ACFQL8_09420 [Streptomyces goshikiensis]|uniref:hypothetical protein n=1 Tax=Streptomyces goshikiensis TaxID=1942 RepID=UPI0033202029